MLKFYYNPLSPIILNPHLKTYLLILPIAFCLLPFAYPDK
jgi:hypothetical protein